MLWKTRVLGTFSPFRLLCYLLCDTLLSKACASKLTGLAHSQIEHNPSASTLREHVIDEASYTRNASTTLSVQPMSKFGQALQSERMETRPVLHIMDEPRKTMCFYLSIAPEILLDTILHKPKKMLYLFILSLLQ